MITKDNYINQIENKVAEHISEGVTHNRSKRIKQRTNAISYGKFGKTLRQCTSKEVKIISEFLDVKVDEEPVKEKSFEELFEEGKMRGPIDRNAVMAKSNYCCDECGNPLSKERDGETHIDHKRPKSFFGSDNIDNLRALCVSCHNARRKNPNYAHKMKIMQGLRTSAGMTGSANHFGLFAAAELVWNMHSDTFYDKYDVMTQLDSLVDDAEKFMNACPECKKCGFFEEYCECNTFTAREPHRLEQWRIK